MAEIVNLNKFRKKKARAAAVVKAAENRVRFGRTKAEKARDVQVELEAQHRLDQLRREREPDEPPAPAES